MGYSKPKHLIKQSTNNTKKVIHKRGHVFISGEFHNRESSLVVFCPFHKEKVTTTFHNYNRSQTGLLCCGRQQVSEKLKFRVFTEETILRMSQGALNRPKRNGKPRKWRKHHEYVQWKKQVSIAYENKCAVTGLSANEAGPLVAHHLNGVNKHPHLTYVVENGILLTKETHVLFHNTYSYHNNTLDQFLDFLMLLLIKQSQQSMLISSQANLERLEGSETRAYDPVRIMELHERLEGIKNNLNKIPIENAVLDESLGPIDDSDSESDSEEN
jgi:hypothetical protein